MRIANPQNIHGEKLMSVYEAPVGKKIIDCQGSQSPEHLSNGCIHHFDLSSGSITEITVPPFNPIAGYSQTAEVWIITSSVNVTVHWPTGTEWIDEESRDKSPTLTTNKLHCFTIRHLGLPEPYNKTIATLQAKI